MPWLLVPIFYFYLFILFIRICLPVNITRRLHTSNIKLSFHILLVLRSDLTKRLPPNTLQ